MRALCLCLCLLLLCLPCRAQNNPQASRQRAVIRLNNHDLNDVRSALLALVDDLECSVDNDSNILIVEGSPATIARVKELLAKLDEPEETVQVMARLMDVTQTGRKALGWPWTSPLEGIARTEMDDGCDAAESAAWEADHSILLRQTHRAAVHANSSLSYLFDQGDASLLATRGCLSLPGQAAEISLSDRTIHTYFAPRTGLFSYRQQENGVHISLTTEVKERGLECDLKVETTQLLAVVNLQYPLARVRVAQCKLRLVEGDSILLGGLFQGEDLERTRPFLEPQTALASKLLTAPGIHEIVLILTPTVRRGF